MELPTVGLIIDNVTGANYQRELKLFFEQFQREIVSYEKEITDPDTEHWDSPETMVVVPKWWIEECFKEIFTKNFI